MAIRETPKLVNIEEELRHLWSSLDQATQTHACLFTLVAYTHSPSKVPWLQGLIQRVMQQYPCRVLCIVTDAESADEYLRCDVAAETIQTGSRGITCDIITIQAAGKHMEAVPYLALPHLLPDLPLHLLWAEDPTLDEHILPHFINSASRLLFDGTQCSPLKDFASRGLSLLEHFQGEFIDLQWSKLSPWRNFLRRAFNQQEHCRQLERTRRLQIRFASEEQSLKTPGLLTPLYLQAWLAQAFQWNFIGTEEVMEDRVLRYQSRFGSVEIVLTPHCFEAEEGMILSFDLMSQEQAHYTFQVDPSLHQLLMNVSTPESCQLPRMYPLTSPHQQQPTLQEMLYSWQRQSYFEMLKLITQC